MEAIATRTRVDAMGRTVGFGSYSLASPPSKKAMFGWTALGTLVGLGVGMFAAKLTDNSTAQGAIVAAGAVVGAGSTAAIVMPNR